MDYTPFHDPGGAVMFALRNGFNITRAPALDNPTIIGMIASKDDRELLLVRVLTHYEWIPVS